MADEVRPETSSCRAGAEFTAGVHGSSGPHHLEAALTIHAGLAESVRVAAGVQDAIAAMTGS